MCAIISAVACLAEKSGIYAVLLEVTMPYKIGLMWSAGGAAPQVLRSAWRGKITGNKPITGWTIKMR